MSLLNFSVNNSFMRADILTYQAIDESFSQKNEPDAQIFKMKLEDKQNSLENYIKMFDEDTANSDEFKQFYNASFAKLSQIEEILKNLSLNPEMIIEISNECLLENDKKIKKLKELLKNKRINCEHFNLSNSQLHTSYYDKIITVQPQNIVYDDEDSYLVDMENNKGNSKMQDMSYIDHETSYERLERIKHLENKFEYINLICEDLQVMTNDQNQLITGVTKNLSDGIQKTAGATKNVQGYYFKKEKAYQRNQFLIIFLIIICICIIEYLW